MSDGLPRAAREGNGPRSRVRETQILKCVRFEAHFT